MADEQKGNGEAAPASAAGKQEFCKKSYDEESKVFTWAFADGETITCRKDEIPSPTWEDLAVHGTLQKGGDSYASAKGDFALGKAKLRGVLDALRSGQWTIGREQGPRLGEVIEAVARIKGKTIDEVKAGIEALEEGALAALRQHPQVKLQMAELRAEKARAAFASAAASTPLPI